MTRNGRTLAIIVAVLAILVFVGPLVAGGVMGPYGMMRGYRGSYGMPGWQGFYGGGFPGGGWGFGLTMGLGALAMLAFWALVVAGVILLVRQFGEHAATGSSPIEVLKRRYAAGEITKDQYDELRREMER